MSNIKLIPQFPSGMSISIVADCDWTDQLYVTTPGMPGAPVTLTGSLAGSNQFTPSFTTGVLPGMLAAGYGIPAAATAQAVSSSIVTLSAAATQTVPSTEVTFFPPPLDLTGISFESVLRSALSDTTVILDMSTANGLMVNSGTLGMFGWAVPAATLKGAPLPAALGAAGTLECVLDIVATDATGARINLCALNGPISVSVSLSVTR